MKERYGFETIAVAGQSGGGSVVGALLTLGRTDIMCAAPGSGAFDVVGLYRLRATLAGRTVTDQQIENYRRLKYSPIDNISGVFKNDARRIFVVGDPRDKNTFFEQQRDFAYRLKAAMHHAVLLYAPGAGAKRHSVGHVADEVAGLCMQGKTDSEIEQAMSKWWQREFTTPAAKTGDGAPNQFSNAAALKAPLTFEAPLAIPGRAR
jgi:Prolyl oligopeptidase family